MERTTKFLDDQLEQCKRLSVFLICFVLAFSATVVCITSALQVGKINKIVVSCLLV